MTVDRKHPPVAGTPSVLLLPDLASGRLDNGMEWLHVTRPGLPLIDLLIVVRAGIDLDPPDAAGLASLAAELFEEGTSSRSGLEIAARTDQLGATLSIRPGWDDTTVVLHALSTRLRAGLELAADVVRNPVFAEPDVRRRREERIGVLIQDGDEPAALVSRAISDAIYGAAHPYGRPARGTRRTVAGIDRDRLAAFHAVRYGPGAAFVVSVGNASASEMEVALQAVFGDWNRTTEAIPTVTAAIRPPARSIRLVDRPGAPQSELRIGRAGPPRTTPDHARLVVLNTVLGGAFTSRLNLKLREEKGFTYGARSTFLFRRGPGPFVAGAAVATADTAEALQDALNEMDRLRQEPVPDPELERAKNYLTLGLPRRLETASAMAAQLADLHLHGLDPSEIVAFVTRVREVGGHDLLDAAAEWLDPERMSIAVVGDAAGTRGALEALRIGAVEPCEVEI